MNVLVLQSELGVLRGGGENFTRNLFAAFAKRGHRIIAAFVANRDGRYPLPLPPSLDPIPLKGWWSINLGQTTLATVGRYIPRRTQLRKNWDRIQEAISSRTIRLQNSRFRKRVEQEFAGRWGQFDVVYVHSNTILASRVANYRPTVLRLPGPVTAELEPLLRRVHAVCANGDALARIRTFLGDHATELPIGIDTDAFRPGPTSIRDQLGWSSQHLVVGYVGRLMHLKGVDILAAAFRKISPQFPDARLLIVGTGPEQACIRSALSKELSHRIVHIESDINHEKLADWYRVMDLLIMPSRYENFSNALMEGMACGIPFLASSVGGNTILEKTGAGWLFESESESSLASCLGQLLRANRELTALGKVARAYVENHCSWAAAAERLESVISSRLGIRSNG